MELYRCQCTGKRGVRIPIHDQPVWRLLHKNLFDRFKHTTGLGSMGSRTNPEMIVWRRDLQFIKEERRHLIIVVLPRMDDDFLVPLPERTTHRRKLDELRTCSYNRCDSHYLPPSLGVLEEAKACSLLYPVCTLRLPSPMAI